MFAIVQCNKYHPKTIRVVNFGEQSPSETLESLSPRECPLCGPLSHTELSFRRMLEVISTHADEESAAAELAKLGGQPEFSLS